MSSFSTRYGPWAIVAGASEGLGEAFARVIAARGVNVALVARREDKVRALADDIARTAGVEVRVVVADLSEPTGLQKVIHETNALDVGLLVYNAAQSFIGPFWETSVEDHLREIDVNVRGPMVLAHAIGARLRARGRGGIVLLSSIAGFQGSPLISNYAATKAYNLVLGEGLWDELRADGVDALVCCAGATRTPNYERSNPAEGGSALVPVQTPEAVAEEALAYLGRGPLLIPGPANRFASFFMRRVLGRRAAVRIMGQNMRKMYGSSGRR